MLSKIFLLDSFSSKLFFASNSEQKLNTQKYQEYLTYTSLLIQTFTSNKEVFYTSKIILDKLIDDLSMEELCLLAQKDEFFIKHMMLVSLKVHQQYSEQILVQMQSNLNNEYEPTDDEVLFIHKIKNYQDQIKEVVSPFKYLETTKSQIGVKLANKIEMILEYIVSDHRFFMINSGLLYAMSLKWMLLKQHKMICQQIQEFLNEFTTSEQEIVLKKIEQMMEQISKM